MIGGWSTEQGREQRDERGEILLLVLAMLVVLGLLAGGLAGLAAPSFAHAAATRGLNDTVAASDSGVEYGIQYLKDNGGQCPTSGDVPPLINRAVQVSCSVVTSVPGSGLSSILLVSTAQISSTSTIESRAVVEINDDTGSATVMSWRTCRSGEC